MRLNIERPHRDATDQARNVAPAGRPKSSDVNSVDAHLLQKSSPQIRQWCLRPTSYMNTLSQAVC